MRSLAMLALGGLCALLNASEAEAQGAATSSQIKGVYELYTSQGCATCPAADALLGRLAKRDDLIALTLPVDYWNYLGWRDTLARPEFTARQKSYASVLGNGMLYTPQAVVNGLAHVNGSSKDRLEQALEKTAKVFAAARVPINLSTKDGTLLIDVAAAPTASAKAATVWVAAIAGSVKVPITRGENRGRTIVYTNVVRRLIPIGTWDGKEMVVHLDTRSFMLDGADRCAVLLQEGYGGPIVGAALIDWL